MSWKTFLDQERKLDYYKELKNKIDYEYQHYTCFPQYNLLYNALKMTKMEDVKVVILGQDPYHEPNQAHGLAFSVLCEKLPPSLKNIYQEMQNDLGVEVKQDGNLEYLAKQGVLLLNTVLSVRLGEAYSHSNMGWEILTDHIISKLNSLDQPIVFILWGSHAQKKKALLNNSKHFIIESAHPSPLSAYRGFFGSKPFSKTNNFLMSCGLQPIKWVKAQYLSSL
ncbi:TPA: uracil-DNA glycosylase [Candidatus Avacholeplasma faecigallinarum]|nr:uracil-DNA glycosylase [Candidatus Avacholeplasma faecigallinarum]